MRQKQFRISLETLCGLFGVSRQAYCETQTLERKTSVANMIVIGYFKELRLIMPLLGGRKLFNELAPLLIKHGN